MEISSAAFAELPAIGKASTAAAITVAAWIADLLRLGLIVMTFSSADGAPLWRALSIDRGWPMFEGLAEPKPSRPRSLSCSRQTPSARPARGRFEGSAGLVA